MKEKDPRIILIKAICMILVVVDHSGCPPVLLNADLSMLMPIFFICSGYFFKVTWFDNKREYVKRKVMSLYVPFVKWSLIFLMLHNLFYILGIINSQYGNTEGVVSGLYSLREMGTRALHITLSMSQYEGFLLAPYWFMRALFVSLMVMCVGGWLVKRLTRSAHWAVALMSTTGFAVAGYMAWQQQPVTWFPQGGYREMMALFFLGVGYAMHKFDHLWQHSWVAMAAFVVFVTTVAIQPAPLHPSLPMWCAVPITGTCGFIFMHRLCTWIDRYASPGINKMLLLVGDKTFYVFTFHLLMMKPASLLKAYINGLDWQAIGCHPYVHLVDDNWFWLIYVATAVPLSLLAGHWMDKVSWLKA